MKINIKNVLEPDVHLRDVTINYDKILSSTIDNNKYKRVAKILVVWDVATNEGDGVPVQFEDNEKSGYFILPTSAIKKPQLINVSMIKFYFGDSDMEKPEVHLFSVNFTSSENTQLRFVQQ